LEPSNPNGKEASIHQSAVSDRFAMTELCVDFHVSRKTGYKWLRRYQAGGGWPHDAAPGWALLPARILRRIGCGHRSCVPGDFISEASPPSSGAVFAEIPHAPLPLHPLPPDPVSWQLAWDDGSRDQGHWTPHAKRMVGQLAGMNSDSGLVQLQRNGNGRAIRGFALDATCLEPLATSREFVLDR
jgi:hypothetical protein